MKLSSISEKILNTFRVKQMTGGLEITDQVMRLGIAEGSAWQFYAVRMEPGILEGGKIKDRIRFLEYLAALKAKVFGKPDPKNRKKLHVTVALGETAMFNQIFSLPFIKGENLEQAAKLNLQMSSPADFAQVYSGWQIVKQDESQARVELLGAFTDRVLIDDLVAALFEAGYVAISIESKALALARLLREQGRGIDMGAPYIMVGVDDAGLDFLIIRGGQLYFEYANVWRDLQSEDGTIPAERFQESLETSLRQVMNFYLQHWEGRVEGVIVSSGVFMSEIERAAEDALSLQVYSLSAMMGDRIAPEWFVAFGTGLRSQYARSKDHEITLLGEEAQETYEKDRILGFAEFWRFFIPTMLVILVALFGLANFIFSRIDAGLPRPRVGPSPQAGDIAALQSQAAAFNQSVAMIASIENGSQPKSAILDAIASAAAANGVVLSRVSYPSAGAPVYVAGTAASSSAILDFKAAVASDTQFSSVDLPLAGIQNVGGNYAFSMTAEVKE
ncbi:MAG: hypothetical protein KGJ13_03355 [Patescibacteria group bacterium]|nr:hypothetical protein [Patescibacteria group bacterium]